LAQLGFLDIRALATATSGGATTTATTNHNIAIHLR
jgi:hypothetical protein